MFYKSRDPTSEKKANFDMNLNNMSNNEVETE